MIRFSSRVVLLTFLYFIQGLPYGLQARFLPVYLRTKGHSLTSLGFFKMLLAPWLCKALWAPLVDKYSTKQKWLQGSIFGLLIICALTSIMPPDNAICLCVAIFLLNLFAATQDIAVDSIAVNILLPDELGQGNTAQVVGYKLGAIFGGGILVWFMDFLGWTGLFLALTLLYVEALLFVYLSPTMRRFNRLQMRKNIDVVDPNMYKRTASLLSDQRKTEDAEMIVASRSESTDTKESTEALSDKGFESSQNFDNDETISKTVEPIALDSSNKELAVERCTEKDLSIKGQTEGSVDYCLDTESQSAHSAESTKARQTENVNSLTCDTLELHENPDEDISSEASHVMKEIMPDEKPPECILSDSDLSNKVCERSCEASLSESQPEGPGYAGKDSEIQTCRNKDCENENTNLTTNMNNSPAQKDTNKTNTRLPFVDSLSSDEVFGEIQTGSIQRNRDELDPLADISDGSEEDPEVCETPSYENTASYVDDLTLGLKKRNVEKSETPSSDESEECMSDSSDAPSQDSFTCSSVKVSGGLAFICDLINVPNTRWIIVYVLIYKLGEQGALGMLPLFFVDSRVRAADVTFWTGVVGQGTSIIGSCLGGWILSHPKYKLPCKLLIYQLSLFRLLPLGMLLWVVMLWSSPMLSSAILYRVAIVALNILLLVSGMVTTATFTLMMECTRQAPSHIQATHYTFLSSLEVFGKLIFMSVCGALVDLFGYTTMFLVFVILAASLLPWLWRYPDILCRKEKVN